MKCRSRTLWWESCALLPSLSMWHILLRSSPHCNQGPAAKSQRQLVAGKQWEPRGVVLAGAPGEQTATAARVPQFQEWVGWVESKRMTLGSPSPPSQTHFLSLLSTHCCSKLCTIVCLGRLLQGGAPLLVFVQPVRELSGPSDLSLTLSPEILSPLTQAITFMGFVHMV